MSCAKGSGRRERCFNQGRIAGFRSERRGPIPGASTRKVYCNKINRGLAELRSMGYQDLGDNASCFQKGFELGQADRRRVSAKRRRGAPPPPSRSRGRKASARKPAVQTTRKRTAKRAAPRKRTATVRPRWRY